MTDNYLLAAKAQLDRDLVPGHPLRRVVDELIEAIKDRDEARAAARKYLGPLKDLPRDTRQHVLRAHPWLKEEE